MTPTDITPPVPSASPSSRRIEVLGVAACAIVLTLSRLHAFDLPLETDEANYAYVGERLLEGDRLYVDVWDHQPPGVFLLFAGVMALFGNDPLAFRFLALGTSLVTLLLIHLFLRRSESLRVALFGTMLFALLSSDPGTAGEGCNREIYMAALVMGAWYCVGRAPSPSWGAWLGAGLLLGVASLLKTIIAVHWVALSVWWMGASFRARRSGIDSARDVFWFGLGPALIWLGTLSYFAWMDRFDVFIDAVFGFNLGYSDVGGSFFRRFWAFFTAPGHPAVFQSARPFWIAGGLATAALGVEGVRRRDARVGMVIALIVAGYVAAALPAQFWPHYYYLMIPTLTISSAAAAGRWPARAPISSNGRRRWAASGAMGILLVGVAAFQGYYYWSRDGLEITKPRYNTRDYWARAHGHKAAQVTDPGDTIFVYGNDAGIYYYSNRRCASRFTMTLALRDTYAGSKERRATLLRELEARRPRLILLADETPFPEWVAFLKRYYGEPIGFDFHDDDAERIILIVVADKERPVRTLDWNWNQSESRTSVPRQAPF